LLLGPNAFDVILNNIKGVQTWSRF